MDTPPRSLGQRDWWILLPWKRNQARCPNPSIVCLCPPGRVVGERGGKQHGWAPWSASWLWQSTDWHNMPPELSHPVRNLRVKWKGQGLWRSATRIRVLVPGRELSLLSEVMIHPLVRLMGGSKPLLPNGSTNECCEHDCTYQRGSLLDMKNEQRVIDKRPHWPLCKSIPKAWSLAWWRLKKMSLISCFCLLRYIPGYNARYAVINMYQKHRQGPRRAQSLRETLILVEDLRRLHGGGGSDSEKGFQ